MFFTKEGRLPWAQEGVLAPRDRYQGRIPMRFLVTGAAGFIGSHLCEKLLALGHEVAGVDCFVPYYPKAIKENNLSGLIGQPGFQFHALDLRSDSLEIPTRNCDGVFHLAAMAGLRQSWIDFQSYVTCNLLATQRLIEALKPNRQLQKFIYVSTSSVYGKDSSGDETTPTCPISPYGVTKLGGEQLCKAYQSEFGFPLVILRYFSVYGPRQRPDMGYHKFIQALLTGNKITVHGDGQQSRGNTFIADCVDATIASLNSPVGETFNVGGGEKATVWDILQKLQTLTSIRPNVVMSEARAGDQRSSEADIAKITSLLGWTPKVSLDDGLAMQVDWQRGLVARKAA